MEQTANINEIKIQIDETTQIMKNNIQKVLERDEKLCDLETQSDALVHDSERFHKGAKKLKWKFYWADKRFLACIVFILLFLILVLVIVFAKK